MPLRKGDLLGDFTILGLIGRGGMGEVYRARDGRLGRDVALKLLPAHFAATAQFRQRFIREARLLASLNHPSIAALHDFQEHQDSFFLVMELVEGETLADRIRRGPLSLPETLTTFLQIAEGLAEAHAQRVIHRDLKPGNLKYALGGRIKIIDFGIARSFDSPMDPDAADVPDDITRTGVVIGTPAYMSPEQTTASPLDHRTDIWSFGCCLFESLTGERLYSADHPMGLVAKVVSDEPEWNRLPPFVSPELRNLLISCLRIDPQHRLPDISLAASALKGLLRGLELPPTPVPPPAAKRSRYSVLLALDFTSPSADPDQVPSPVAQSVIVVPPAEVRRAVDQSLERFDGHELAHRDGRYLVAFELPSRAVLFALSLQRRLSEIPLSERLDAKVGIHTGELQSGGEEEAELECSKARGVVRGALELMQFAAPRQVLISEAAYSSARARFDDSKFGEQTTWLDHGVFEIEGLGPSIRIHEAGLIGVSRLKPPPPAPSVRPKPARRSLGVGALSRRSS